MSSSQRCSSDVQFPKCQEMLFFQHSCGVETGWKLRCCQMNRTKHLMVLIHFYLFIMQVCVFSQTIWSIFMTTSMVLLRTKPLNLPKPNLSYTGWTVASSQLVWDLTTVVITSSVRLWLDTYRQQAESSFSHKRNFFFFFLFCLSCLSGPSQWIWNQGVIEMQTLF